MTDNDPVARWRVAPFLRFVAGSAVAAAVVTCGWFAFGELRDRARTSRQVADHVRAAGRLAADGELQAAMAGLFAARELSPRDADLLG